jgi:hypothetical protein
MNNKKLNYLEEVQPLNFMNFTVTLCLQNVYIYIGTFYKFNTFSLQKFLSASDSANIELDFVLR